MKQILKFNSIKLSVFFLTLFLFSQISISNSTYIANQAESTLSYNSWKITTWNEESLVYFYPIGNIQALNGSIIWYNVTDYDNLNYTYPSLGMFSFGNLSDYSNNYDIGSNLALSIWPWIPGLLTHNNWTWHKLEIQKATLEGFSQGETNIKENKGYNFSNLTRNSIKFVYHQNISLGNQNTTLIYDMDSGVLLYGFSEIFIKNYYVLEITLKSSTLINSSNYISSVNFSNYFIIGFFCLTIPKLLFKISKKVKIKDSYFVL